MLLGEKEISNAVAWLLAHSGPSIRYRTMTELQHRGADDGDVRRAYSEILACKRLHQIAALPGLMLCSSRA